MTIRINCRDADFTPTGKRTWRVLWLKSGVFDVQRIRWYVRGRIYRTLPSTCANLNLSREWSDAR